MSATKIRKRLKKFDEELDGMIPPKWLKKRCDGCSVPTKLAKRSYIATMLRAGCDIHDAEYTTIPIMWDRTSKKAKQERRNSDKRLRENIKIIMSARGKHPIRGKFVGTVFWMALRPFGRWALTDPRCTKLERLPLTDQEDKDFLDMIEEFYGPLTEHAKDKLADVTIERKLANYVRTH